MKAYSLLFAIGCVVLLVGLLSLVSFFSGQIREGYAPETQLWMGVVGFFAGIVLAALGDIGRRLIRAERRRETGAPGVQGNQQLIAAKRIRPVRRIRSRAAVVCSLFGSRLPKSALILFPLQPAVS